jgi:hypothetical protein
MYTQVAQNQVVTSASSQFSQAVSMSGGNAVQIEAVLFVKGGGNFSIQLQGSNDLENWDDVGSAIAMTAVGFATDSCPDIAFQYVRLAYSQATSGTGIVAAGVNVANL